jgi:hypothetical protein
LYDVGTQEGTDYLVMEYLEGYTLAVRLTRGPMPLHEALQTGSQISGALEQAHRQGIVHRDLKPGNVMLTAHGAKLMDFGLAKPATTALGAALSVAGASPTQENPVAPLTAQGAIVGTFQYMSPEQLEGREPDFRSDIFSLGVMLYEMATGVHPFVGVSPASTIAHILSSEPTPLKERAPATPPELDRIARKCLRKKREERYQSTSDLLVDLQSLRSGSAASESAAAPSLTRKWWWAHQIGQMLIGLAVLQLVWQARPSLPPALRQELFFSEVFAIGLYWSLRFYLVSVAIGNPLALPAEVRRLRAGIQLTGWVIVAGLVSIAVLIAETNALLATILGALATGGFVSVHLLNPATDRSAFGELATPPRGVARGDVIQGPRLVLAGGQFLLAGLLGSFARVAEMGAEASLWQWARGNPGRGDPSWVLHLFWLLFVLLVLLTIAWGGIALLMWRSPRQWAERFRRWIVYFFMADLLCAPIAFVAAMRFQADTGKENMLLGLLAFVSVAAIPFLQGVAAQRLAPGKRSSTLALLLPWTKL